MATIRPALLIQAILFVAVHFSSASTAQPLEPNGCYRYPDVRGDLVVFTSEGDLWAASLSRGGEALRLTRHDGLESYARISPDGKWIAFTGEYDGNRDVYLIPSTGGEPKRLTFHPAWDEVVGWNPSGDSIIFRSHRDTPNFTWKLYLVSPSGGITRDLGLDKGTRIAFEPGGDRIAFTRIRLERSSWKRYKGGLAMDIWIGNLKTLDFRQATDYDGTDGFPMWIGDRLYFLSDRSGRANLFSMKPDGSDLKQHTFEDTWDLRFPSTDGRTIIFQKAMDLWAFDIATGKARSLNISLPSDRLQAREKLSDPSGYIDQVSIPNSGKRIAMTARGELFTAPVEEKGYIRQLSRTPGAREKWVDWSPDGKTIAVMSDASGEDEIWLFPSDGKSPARQLTHGGTMIRYPPAWSPDGKMILFQDKAHRLWIADAEDGDLTLVSEGARVWSDQWSPDSKWLAFLRNEDDIDGELWLYNLDSKDQIRISRPMTDEIDLSWDPEGKFLYFASANWYNPLFSALEPSYAFTTPTKFYVLLLAKGTKNPFAPRLIEGFEQDEDKKKDDKDDEEKDESKDKKDKDKKKDEKEEKVEVKIDTEGLPDRIYQVPIDAGNYFGLTAVKERLYYGVWRNDGATAQGKRPEGFQLVTFDVKKKKTETVSETVNGFQFSADLKKMLVQTPGNNFIVMDAGGTKIPEDEGKVDLSDWTIDVEPRAEWTQILREVWRLQRDFFYDPNMHGVDWSAVWTQYSALLPRISNRDELNDLIAEMLGELNCGHAYVGGGDMISARDVPIGGLGADLEPTPEGSWRIRKILRGDGWGDEPVSPLAAPLASAKAGDYIVAIDGEPLKPGEDIYAHLVGRAGKEILLSLSEKPKSDGARDVPVRALDDESYLRYLDWVRDRREYVDSVSGGRIGYIHLPDMGIEGLTMWGRMYLPQCRKDALIMDVRYNRGGSVADMILAQLGNKVWALTKGRDDPVGRRFGTAFYGPMDAICNHETGSDGETFSEGFRRLGLGKVFGTRTWGGWVGIYGGRPLVDRGFNTIPQISGWGAFDGKWLIEGPGVYPDVEVVDEPAQIIRGRDPQLDAAIADLTKQLETWPKLAPQPPYPKKPLEIKNLK